jgi:hypothetical protein
MESKHTPGPWQIYKDRNRIDRYPGIDGVTRTVIVFGVDGESNGVRGQNYEESLANAHLIAAAPELLDALELLVAWANIQDGSPSQYLRDAALAAINKAKGQ